MTSLKATLTFGVSRAGNDATSVTGTLLGYEKVAVRVARSPVELDETLDATDVSATIARLSNPMNTQTRTTVLPRRVRQADGPSEPNHEERPRFERMRQLGEGAVGTVELARDNDIRRTVAVKKLRTEVRSSGSLLRFADEVRIVGQLEHPSIVPIYDVGRDEAGDVYLVMKHLEGETMEDVIEKLRAGDPVYHARFTFEARARLFLCVLDAIRYAHSRGVLHRDLKPANIMIGPYDEVTVMDWGIAKPFGRGERAPAPRDAARSWLDSQDQRLLETQLGTLAGTPFYMSPEQAAGQNDTLDARSDVYALSVLFYEWLALEHPLVGKTTLMQVLASIITEEHDQRSLIRRAGQSGVPCEFVYLIARGLKRDREERLASADAMYSALADILAGRVAVQCPVTLTKRATHDAMRWVDHHHRLFLAGFALCVVGVVAGVGALAFALVRAFG